MSRASRVREISLRSLGTRKKHGWLHVSLQTWFVYLIFRSAAFLLTLRKQICVIPVLSVLLHGSVVVAVVDCRLKLFLGRKKIHGLRKTKPTLSYVICIIHTIRTYHTVGNSICMFYPGNCLKYLVSMSHVCIPL